MLITEVTGNRENYLDLLLLADPSEKMVRKYLDGGIMLIAVEDNKTIGEIIAVPVSPIEWEIKNLAVNEAYRGRGYGMALILSLSGRLREGTVLIVGTSDSNVEFYEKCGFFYFRTEPGYFTENYPEPIFENGRQCTDLIYLKQTL